MKNGNLSKNLKHYRKLNRLTQAELSELLGISTNYVARMETDQALPSNETLKQLSLILKIPMDYLLREDFGDPNIFEHSRIPKELESLSDEQVTELLNTVRALYDEIKR